MSLSRSSICPSAEVAVAPGVAAGGGVAGAPLGGGGCLPPAAGGAAGGFEAWSTRTSKWTVPLGGGATWAGAGAGTGAGAGVWAEAGEQVAKPANDMTSERSKRSMGPRAVRRRLRALWSLDITVPIGQLSTLAISRYENPSTSLSMIMARALGGKVSSAVLMRFRRSAPIAA